MLKGKKILLRPLRFDDIEKTMDWRNDLQIKNMVLMHPFPVSINIEKNWFERNINKINNELIILGIELIESKELIGYAKLFNINWIHRYCYFGIIIGEKKTRGKGIGEETTYLMMDYSFKTLNLRKILLEVLASNKSAIKLYEKLGFVVEGILKKQVFINNKYDDVIIMTTYNT